MSFWDDRAGYDIRDRKHPDYANAARGLKDLVRGQGGATRYVCPEGCGASFDSMAERELHFILEHDGKDAA